ELVVAPRVPLALLGPSVEIPELNAQDRGLQSVEPEIAADHGVVVLRLAAVNAQHPQLLGELGVVGDAHPPVAERAEVLAREERKAADIAEAAGAPPVRERRADRLRRVLDDGETEITGDRGQAVHIRHLAEKMD